MLTIASYVEDANEAVLLRHVFELAGGCLVIPRAREGDLGTFTKYRIRRDVQDSAQEKQATKRQMLHSIAPSGSLSVRRSGSSSHQVSRTGKAMEAFNMTQSAQLPPIETAMFQLRISESRAGRRYAD